MLAGVIAEAGADTLNVARAARGGKSVSPHAQFTVLALLGCALTAPALSAAWRLRLADRCLASVFYLVGFGLIGATLALDPILQPPLFFHGFVPGIGIGAVAIALALVALARRRTRVYD